MNDFTPAMSPVPPTIMGELVPRPPVWPNVVGIICIVIGGLGIMTYGCLRMIGYAVTPMMSKAIAQTSPIQAAQFEAAKQYLLWNIAVDSAATGLAIVLLIAGIGLVRRRRSAVKLARTWAVLRLVLALPQAIVTFLATSAQLQAMQQAAADSGQPMPAIGGFIGAIGTFTVAVTLAWAAAWPAFLLIWLARSKVASHVADWR